ncbi:MAG: DNA-3-methyladenine glycosylase [Oscillospiraceae bacterium]|nr:DNA-3-methyladenine glycosylase [Oscillospiraceae bacterium]
MKLDRAFYERDTVTVARELLGKYLVHRLEGETLCVRLTETEAYVGPIDKACHAYNYRRTKRTSVMFGPPGHAYIYFIYGMYYCLNIVTEPEGEPCAVLLRGAAPAGDESALFRHRFGGSAGGWTAYRRKNFLNGPGKLTLAMGLTAAQNGLDLCGQTLFLCDDPADAGLPSVPQRPFHIGTGPRIGIDYAEEAVDFPWRFTLAEDEI